MKKILLLSFALVAILSSCEKRKYDSFSENPRRIILYSGGVKVAEYETKSAIDKLSHGVIEFYDGRTDSLIAWQGDFIIKQKD